MVCRGKTRERGGDKELNRNSSPCVPLPLTAAGRLVSPILDSSAAPTLSVLPRLPLFSFPSSSTSSSPRQVAAEVLPFHSPTPSALQPRLRGLRVHRLFVVFIRRSGLFTRTLQSRHSSLRLNGGGDQSSCVTEWWHGESPWCKTSKRNLYHVSLNSCSRGSNMFPTG